MYTNFSSLRLGDAGNGDTSTNVAFNQALGASVSPVYVYDVVPTQTNVSNIAPAATVSNGAWTISSATGVTTTTINGVSYVDLGCQRNITASGASTGVTAVDITFAGLDDYFKGVTCTFSGPSSTALTSSIKTVRYVRTVYTSGNTTSNVSIGTGDVFGLPYRVDAFGYTVLNWSSTVITANTGFTAAVTTTATAYTGDTRGTYLVPSASDGTKRLTAFIYVKNPDTMTGLYGVTQA
jgi:hypothetical protein